MVLWSARTVVINLFFAKKDKAFLNSDLKMNVAYQNVKESRHNRRFNNYNLQYNEENVDMFSVSLDLNKNSPKENCFMVLNRIMKL